MNKNCAEDIKIANNHIKYVLTQKEKIFKIPCII